MLAADLSHDVLYGVRVDWERVPRSVFVTRFGSVPLSIERLAVMLHEAKHY
jgi:hypothetical protein